MQNHPTTTTLAVAGITAPVVLRVFRAVPARPAPLVLHLPCGTFAALPEHRPVPALLAEAGAVVLSLDYPVGPGHPFPAAAEFAYLVLQHLYGHRTRWATRASKLFVAGEEAGGNLAAALAIIARDRLGPPLSGQILLSPMLDPGMATCSFRDAEAGPVGCKWADGWTRYLGGSRHAAHPYAAPAGASRLQGLPPALIVTTTDDPMRDEALAYAHRLHLAGVALQVRALKADNWPDALAGPAQPEWEAPLRTAFARFFAQFVATTTPSLVPAQASKESLA